MTIDKHDLKYLRGKAVLALDLFEEVHKTFMGVEQDDSEAYKVLKKIDDLLDWEAMNYSRLVAFREMGLL